MTPILGITASQITGHLWQPGKDFDSIATVTVGAGGSSSISFTSIPSTYKHLQIRFIARGTLADSNADMYCYLNSDTTQANYARHNLRGNGTAASAGGAAASTIPIAGYISGSLSTASVYGAGVIDILDYANTNKYKTVRSLAGYDQNGQGSIYLFSNLYMQTTAISSINFVVQSNNFEQYTQIALYGVK
jgi:hypothetical protein